MCSFAIILRMSDIGHGAAPQNPLSREDKSILSLVTSGWFSMSIYVVGVPYIIVHLQIMRLHSNQKLQLLKYTYEKLLLSYSPFRLGCA